MKFIAEDFIERQLSVWPLACENYSALSSVRRREFDMGGYRVVLQFNPARRISTGANMSASAVNSRPCFLCSHNRPSEQMAHRVGNFDILVNPFPIFSRHLTIVNREHQDQHLLPFVDDMMSFARMLPDMVVFFNGACCGASAPDHMHFQAAQSDSWPVLDDFERSEKRDVTLGASLKATEAVSIGRRVVRLVSDDAVAVRDAIAELTGGDDTMVNVLMYAVEGRVSTYVVPRKSFRPWQYTAEGDEQLMVSPASVEVGGVFVTPVEEHFEKFTAEDVRSIYEQVCYQINEKQLNNQ